MRSLPDISSSVISPLPFPPHSPLLYLSQCPRPKGDIYCGEVLLGIKFEPEKLTLSDHRVNGGHSLSSTEASPEEQRGGELHVHVIEGAGLINEETHKPYKTVVKW